VRTVIDTYAWIESLFDAIILATARTLNAKIITGDEHFRDLDETLWIGREN